MQYYVHSNRLMDLGYFYTQWRKAKSSKGDFTNSDSLNLSSSSSCNVGLGSVMLEYPIFVYPLFRWLYDAVRMLFRYELS